MIRTLPFPTVPVAGESFTSYIDRAAWRLGASPHALLARVFPDSVDLAILRYAYGKSVDLPDDLIEHVALACGLEPHQLEPLFLRRATPLASRLPADPRNLPSDQLRRQLRTSTLRLTTSLFCPRCLRDDGGAWHLHWRYPIAFMCARHRVLLEPACTSCVRPAGETRSEKASIRTFIRWTLNPTRCRNSIRGQGRHGHNATPCASDLADTPTTPIKSRRLSRAQLRIAAIDDFNELRRLQTVTSYLMQYSPDLGDFPDAVATPFRDYAFRRDSARRRGVFTGRNQKGDPEPRVLAGPLTLASELLFADFDPTPMTTSIHRQAYELGQYLATESALALDPDVLEIAGRVGWNAVRTAIRDSRPSAAGWRG
jgi:hypothetical protein